MRIKDFEEAKKYLYSLESQKTHSGNLGLERTKALCILIKNAFKKGKFWKFLENNNSFANPKIIHIAGTSGKGSVAYILSSLLINQGFKVGLHISPHLLDLRERMQINNNLISKEKFISYLNEVIGYIEEIKNSKYGHPAYLEVMIAFAIYIFNKEKVDYIVMETGIGGTYDPTNVLNNKIAILTRIALDHTNILGKTFKEIAQQKAGIIKKDNPVITFNQKINVNQVFLEKSKQENAELNLVKINNARFYEALSIFNFKFKDFFLENILLSLRGTHQIENCSLALATIYVLSKKNKFTLDENKIKNTLKCLNFKGRMEIIKSGDSKIIIDGAHNINKMRNLINSIKTLYPNQKFDFLVGFKAEKKVAEMLKIINEISNNIYLTEFFIKSEQNIRTCYDINSIKQGIKIKNSKEALKIALNSKNLVITGSLFLLSELYDDITR